jgi:type VI secretion system secreted protein VgrG
MGLGMDVDVLVSMSRSLSDDINTLLRRGWRFQHGKPGSPGSYANRPTKTVVVDSAEQGDTEAVAETIAHKAGHAMYTLKPYVPASA